MTNGERERACEFAAQSIHGTNKFSKGEKERIISYFRERAGWYRAKRIRSNERELGQVKRREIL